MGTLAQIPGAYIGAIVTDSYGIVWIFLASGIFLIIFGQFLWLAKETYTGKKSLMIDEISDETVSADSDNRLNP